MLWWLSAVAAAPFSTPHFEAESAAFKALLAKHATASTESDPVAVEKPRALGLARLWGEAGSSSNPSEGDFNLDLPDSEAEPNSAVPAEPIEPYSAPERRSSGSAQKDGEEDAHTTFAPLEVPAPDSSTLDFPAQLSYGSRGGDHLGQFTSGQIDAFSEFRRMNSGHDDRAVANASPVSSAPRVGDAMDAVSMDAHAPPSRQAGDAMDADVPPPREPGDAMDAVAMDAVAPPPREAPSTPPEADVQSAPEDAYVAETSPLPALTAAPASYTSPEPLPEIATGTSPAPVLDVSLSPALSPEAAAVAAQLDPANFVSEGSPSWTSSALDKIVAPRLPWSGDSSSSEPRTETAPPQAKTEPAPPGDAWSDDQAGWSSNGEQVHAWSGAPAPDSVAAEVAAATASVGASAWSSSEAQDAKKSDAPSVSPAFAALVRQGLTPPEQAPRTSLVIKRLPIATEVEALPDSGESLPIDQQIAQSTWADSTWGPGSGVSTPRSSLRGAQGPPVFEGIRLESEGMRLEEGLAGPVVPAIPSLSPEAAAVAASLEAPVAVTGSFASDLPSWVPSWAGKVLDRTLRPQLPWGTPPGAPRGPSPMAAALPAPAPEVHSVTQDQEGIENAAVEQLEAAADRAEKTVAAASDDVAAESAPAPPLVLSPMAAVTSSDSDADSASLKANISRFFTLAAPLAANASATVKVSTAVAPKTAAAPRVAHNLWAPAAAAPHVSPVALPRVNLWAPAPHYTPSAAPVTFEDKADKQVASAIDKIDAIRGKSAVDDDSDENQIEVIYTAPTVSPGALLTAQAGNFARHDTGDVAFSRVFAALNGDAADSQAWPQV